MNTEKDTTENQSVLETLRNNGQPPIEENSIVVLNNVSSTERGQEPLFEAFSEQEQQTYDLVIQMIRIYGILPVFEAIEFGEWADIREYNQVRQPLTHFMMAVERAAFALFELKYMHDSEVDMFYSRVRARADSRKMSYEEGLKMYLIEKAYDLITEHDHGDFASIEVLPENNHPANQHALSLMQQIPPNEMCEVETNRLVPWIERITPDYLYLLQLMKYGYEGQHEALAAWRRDRDEFDRVRDAHPFCPIHLHDKLFELMHETSPEEAMEFLNISEYFLYQQTPVQGAVALLDNLLWKTWGQVNRDAS